MKPYLCVVNIGYFNEVYPVVNLHYTPVLKEDETFYCGEGNTLFEKSKEGGKPDYFLGRSDAINYWKYLELENDGDSPSLPADEIYEFVKSCITNAKEHFEKCVKWFQKGLQTIQTVESYASNADNVSLYLPWKEMKERLYDTSSED